MTKTPKRPRDPNQLARMIVDIATGEAPPAQPADNAVTKGRPGGLSGGPARAEKLSPERRSEIAKAAAAKRWER